MRMRRFLIGVAAALGSALTLANLTGCAAAEEPGTLQNNNPLGNYVNQLRELPGVESATLGITGQQTDVYGLNVTLTDDITTEELSTVGSEAANFTTITSDAGLTASQPKLKRGESSFEYFDNLDGDALTAQLAYWMHLQLDGIDSVAMSGYTERISTLQSDPTTSPTPDPRYVAIELPADADADVADSIVAQLRQVTDPGAESGQWDLVVPSAHFKGEFHDAKFPSVTEYGYLSTVASTFMPVDDLASAEVSYYPDHDVPLQIEVVSFDSETDNLTAEEADVAFQQTAIWEQLAPLMEDLADHVNYQVEVLGNPLSDGGNFKLDFTVSDCAFTGDSTWPESSAALGEIWQHAMKHSSAKCSPEVVPSP